MTFWSKLKLFRVGLLSKHNQSGFGLIEVVMAAGILAVLLYAFTQVLFNSQQGAQSVQKHLDAGQLGSFISSSLSNCTTSGLIGQTAPAAKLPTTTDTVSVPTLSFANLKFDDSANSAFGNGQVQIASLKWHSVSIAGTTYQTVIRLQVSVQSPGSQTVVGGSLLSPVDFPLTLTVSGGTITACGTSTFTSGVTPLLPNFGSSTNCAGAPPGAGWMSSGTPLGANKNCVSFVTASGTGTGGSGSGCYYDSGSGLIYYCANNMAVYCGWICF